MTKLFCLVLSCFFSFLLSDFAENLFKPVASPNPVPASAVSVLNENSAKGKIKSKIIDGLFAACTCTKVVATVMLFPRWQGIPI